MDRTILKPFSLFSNLDRNAVILMDDEGRTEIPLLWRNLWNGAPIRACTNNSAELVCCYAEKNDMKAPTLICGEISRLQPRIKKCFTDSTYCEYCSVEKNHLTRCLECVAQLPQIHEQNMGRKCECIVILGGFSGRLDHVLGDLNAIFSTQVHVKIPIYAIDGNNLITVLTHEGGQFEILVDPHKTTKKCGLVPLKHPHVTSHGLKWDINNEEMHFGGFISTSNEITSDKVEINTTGPVVFNLELANVC
uniref:Thiamine diphosphokinase n=1 Tax=Acrobeloides nanus TaxID=290746 RepID=A0A914E8A8_9BILA